MSVYTEKEQQLFWTCSRYPAAFYRLLGYLLNYYSGTFNPDKAIVSKLFVFDDDVRLIGERDSHLELMSMCKEFFREAVLVDDLIVDIKRIDSERLTTYLFISKNICDYISQADYKIPESLFISLFKPPTGCYPVALYQRLEFIVGAYLFHRSEHQGVWIFFNNYKKATMVYDCMIALVDENDIIQITSTFLTPHVHKLKINTDGSLWSKIKERLLM